MTVPTSTREWAIYWAKDFARMIAEGVALAVFVGSMIVVCLCFT